MKDLMSRLAGKPEEPNDAHAEAKMQVLNELRDMAMSMMGNKMKDQMPGHDDGMEQVSVAAPDKAGLKKGLDMAKNVLPGDEESADEEASESPDQEAQESDDDDMSPEEIDSMIEELQEKKRQAQMKA